ncbi:uncharacterized protein ASCRUDRAFT_75924 [Ascoidea rubescens DSM 1968]|uniref:Uncharacterized protein n=1 Tax=Ascoidea rubescens DSM 1968 TaxID=1344418 RepID=A0A1D2VHX9_9ASCO|nr:hypothetical protein ASCRUDRAFT_75924 [Ascoidea rubescens DSM 1968]ODV61222.1 hypothetical protein ASCRUDRAFT_75924 [Ascoidea rubescens DSM 1968]
MNGILKIDRDFIDHFPSTLKVIATSSNGYDHYDIDYLTKKGIIFCNTPSLAADQVADLALYSTISAFRFTSIVENNFRTSLNAAGNAFLSRKELESDSFDNETGMPVLKPNLASTPPFFSLGDYIGGKRVYSLENRIAGIVGLGAIGKFLAYKLNLVGMKIHYTKTTELTKEEHLNFHFPLTYHQSFEDIAKVSDILIFCLPLTKETKHLLRKETIGLCKDGVKIVNISRGQIINENDLVEALENGKISYAALDVFENEPNIHPKLLKRWDCTITPHIGSSTVENLQLSAHCCQNNICDILLKNGPGITNINKLA